MLDVGSSAAMTIRNSAREQAFLRVLRQPGIGLDHHAGPFWP